MIEVVVELDVESLDVFQWGNNLCAYKIRIIGEYSEDMPAGDNGPFAESFILFRRIYDTNSTNLLTAEDGVVDLKSVNHWISHFD